jgi:hypothetical protein
VNDVFWVFNAIKRKMSVARNWVEAIDKASKGDNAGAMTHLVKMHSLVGECVPSNRVDLETTLMLSAIAANIGQGKLAIEAAEIAATELSGGRGRYNRDEREYLKCYCKDIVRYCAFDLNLGESVKNIFDDIKIDPNPLELHNISKRLRELFPVKFA